MPESGGGPELGKVDDCDLCEAARITPWFHEDDVCWIAECEICYVPMVVWRFHGTEPPSRPPRAHAHASWAEWPGRRSPSSTTSTTTCATSPTTTTPMPARRGASSGTASDVRRTPASRVVRRRATGLRVERALIPMPGGRSSGTANAVTVARREAEASANGRRRDCAATVIPSAIPGAGSAVVPPCGPCRTRRWWPASRLGRP